MQGIVDIIQFVLANSSHKPDDLGKMTLPQVNAIADAIHRFKIHAWGIGLGGKDKPPTADKEHTPEDGRAFVAQFIGL